MRDLPAVLRDLARRVGRLAASGRTDPEAVLLEKETIGCELRRIARELELTHPAEGPARRRRGAA